MVMANSAAIITDAFPARQRGTALGVSQVAGLAGSFVGLVLGGVLSAWHWQAVFWVSVVVGVIGTWWAYRNLRETMGRRADVRIDRRGNLTFATGLTALLAAITWGDPTVRRPHRGLDQPLGGRRPHRRGRPAGGLPCRGDPRHTADVPSAAVPHPGLLGGNAAALLNAIARDGLQFTLIIWLQGIWLPLHGYSFQSTPL
jgi:hypothetical protein